MLASSSGTLGLVPPCRAPWRESSPGRLAGLRASERLKRFRRRRTLSVLRLWRPQTLSLSPRLRSRIELEGPQHSVWRARGPLAHLLTGGRAVLPPVRGTGAPLARRAQAGFVPSDWAQRGRLPDTNVGWLGS